MDSSKKTPATIDEYIAAYPEEVQRLLETMRQTIKAAVPQAEEAIKYGMPTFTLNGKNLVYFAAAKNHIGFYPKPYDVDEAFEKQMAAYKGTKSSVHFPLNKPIPVDLVTQMVQFHVERVMKG